MECTTHLDTFHPEPAAARNQSSVLMENRLWLKDSSY